MTSDACCSSEDFGPNLPGVVSLNNKLHTVEELLTGLRKGSTLRKYGRRGQPKFHYFKLSHDDYCLQWESKKGKIKEVDLRLLVAIHAGQATAVFRRHPQPDYKHVSFSLVYDKGSKERSLDLICSNQVEYDLWYTGVHFVAQMLCRNLGLQTPAKLQLLDHNSGASGGGEHGRTMLLLPPPPSSATATAHISVIESGQVKVVPVTTLAPPSRELGDCYIWGAAVADQADGGASPGSSVPELVGEAWRLDLARLACGGRHAAMATKKGEMYTWGNGTDGCLGHGAAIQVPAPQQVRALFGKGVAALACSDTTTAAVTRDGALFTWGCNSSGQLGHSTPSTHIYVPLRVTANLGDIRLRQVACGPYHTAAVSASGLLYTWGDGLCGKLGHGNQQTSAHPRQVVQLAHVAVTAVSCGWWHTAAVAVLRDQSAATRSAAEAQMRLSRSSNDLHMLGVGGGHAAAAGPGGAEMQLEAGLPSTDAAAAPSPSGGTAGTVFTWGGELSWSTPDGQGGVKKKDHHKGCLALGDTAGRLLPTAVTAVGLEGCIKQVACGLNLTLLLTVDGRVFQAGATGAAVSKEEEKAAFWEGAHTPERVGGALEGMIVEEVACGMQHCVVVATALQPWAPPPMPPTNAASINASFTSLGLNLMAGSPLPAAQGPPQRGTMLIAWGQNSHGQLGLGHLKDTALPTIVQPLSHRKIFHIACGGNHTLAVCEHNAASTNDLITQQRRVMQRRMDTRRIPAQLSLPLPTSMRAPHLGVQPSPCSMARMTDTRRALAAPSPGPSGRPNANGGAGLASVSPSLQRLATMSGGSSANGGSKKGAWGFIKGIVGIGGEATSPHSTDKPGSRRQKGPGMMHELSPRNAPGRLRLGRRFTFMRRISTAGGSGGSRTPNSFTTALQGMSCDERGEDGEEPSSASADREAGQRDGVEHAEPAPRARVQIATGSFTEGQGTDARERRMESLTSDLVRAVSDASSTAAKPEGPLLAALHSLRRGQGAHKRNHSLQLPSSLSPMPSAITTPSPLGLAPAAPDPRSPDLQGHQSDASSTSSALMAAPTRRRNPFSPQAEPQGGSRRPPLSPFATSTQEIPFPQLLATSLQQSQIQMQLQGAGSEGAKEADASSSSSPVTSSPGGLGGSASRHRRGRSNVGFGSAFGVIVSPLPDLGDIPLSRTHTLTAKRGSIAPQEHQDPGFCLPIIAEAGAAHAIAQTDGSSSMDNQSYTRTTTSQGLAGEALLNQYPHHRRRDTADTSVLMGAAAAINLRMQPSTPPALQPLLSTEQGESLEMLFWRKKAERAQRLLEDLGATVEGLESRLRGVEAIFGDATSRQPRDAAERNIAAAHPRQARPQVAGDQLRALSSRVGELEERAAGTCCDLQARISYLEAMAQGIVQGASLAGAEEPLRGSAMAGSSEATTGASPPKLVGAGSRDSSPGSSEEHEASLGSAAATRPASLRSAARDIAAGCSGGAERVLRATCTRLSPADALPACSTCVAPSHQQPYLLKQVKAGGAVGPSAAAPSSRPDPAGMCDDKKASREAALDEPSADLILAFPPAAAMGDVMQ